MNIDNSYYKIRKDAPNRYTTLVISNRCSISGGRPLAPGFFRLNLYMVDYEKL